MITGGTGQKKNTAGRILPQPLEREEYSVDLHGDGSVVGYSFIGETNWLI